MKNDKPMQTYIDDDLEKFIKEQAERNQRSKAGQVRHWLNCIKKDIEGAENGG